MHPKIVVAFLSLFFNMSLVEMEVNQLRQNSFLMNHCPSICSFIKHLQRLLLTFAVCHCQGTKLCLCSGNTTETRQIYNQHCCLSSSCCQIYPGQASSSPIPQSQLNWSLYWIQDNVLYGKNSQNKDNRQNWLNKMITNETPFNMLLLAWLKWLLHK